MPAQTVLCAGSAHNRLHLLGVAPRGTQETSCTHQTDLCVALPQHSSDHGSDGHAAHTGQSSQGSSQQDSDAQQQESKGTCCARNADSCSTPPAFDAAVHVTTAAVSRKQQHEQQATGKLASSWTATPGCCREVDMLAKRSAFSHKVAACAPAAVQLRCHMWSCQRTAGLVILPSNRLPAWCIAVAGCMPIWKPPVGKRSCKRSQKHSQDAAQGF